MYFQACSNLAFPMHSGERYRTIGPLAVAHVIYIRKFNFKYLVIDKVQMHTGAISWLEYGSCVYTGDNPLTDARRLSSRPVQTDEPYTNYLLK